MQSSLRLTAEKSEAPPNARAVGKRMSANQFSAVQDQARKWYEVWPKDDPDASGYAAPRLPVDGLELRQILRQLVGSDQVAVWQPCFEGEYDRA